MKDDAHYQAYLVRFQRSGEQKHWRVTVQNAQTGEQQHFATEQELFHFLAYALDLYPRGLKPFEKGHKLLG